MLRFWVSETHSAESKLIHAAGSSDILTWKKGHIWTASKYLCIFYYIFVLLLCPVFQGIVAGYLGHHPWDRLEPWDSNQTFFVCKNHVGWSENRLRQNQNPTLYHFIICFPIELINKSQNHLPEFSIFFAIYQLFHDQLIDPNFQHRRPRIAAWDCIAEQLERAIPLPRRYVKAVQHFVAGARPPLGQRWLFFVEFTLW